MRREERLAKNTPKEDALLTAEIREMMAQREMMADCGMLGQIPILPAAKPRRQNDPNP